jgi:hypothetical protein
MTKKVLLAALVGWSLAILITPRDVIGFFRPKS